MWRTALKTIYPSPLKSSFPAWPARTLSSLPLGGAPQLDGEGGGVVGLLNLKMGQALWVPPTDLGAWDPLGPWGGGIWSGRRSKRALCPLSHSQSPNPSWDAGSDQHLWLKAEAGPSRRAGLCEPVPGWGTLQGAEHPKPLGVPPRHPAVVALQNVHAMTPSAPAVGSPVLWAESHHLPVLSLFRTSTLSQSTFFPLFLLSLSHGRPQQRSW